MKSRYPIMIGGNNFVCGSSREHAPIAMGAAGARVVVAQSYARIFFRNCVSTFVPLFPVFPIDAVDLSILWDAEVAECSRHKPYKSWRALKGRLSSLQGGRIKGELCFKPLKPQGCIAVSYRTPATVTDWNCGSNLNFIWPLGAVESCTPVRRMPG